MDHRHCSKSIAIESFILCKWWNRPIFVVYKNIPTHYNDSPFAICPSHLSIILLRSNKIRNCELNTSISWISLLVDSWAGRWKLSFKLIQKTISESYILSICSRTDRWAIYELHIVLLRMFSILIWRIYNICLLYFREKAV